MGAFNVSSKINLNFGKLRELDHNTQKALEMTTDALLTEVKNAQVMPFDTGNLQNESTFADYSNSDKGVASIVSTTPYARRLYFHPEFNFSREENIAAGAEWFIPWQKGGTRENFCVDTFAKIYKELCGL
ncbi:hypothetical protein [uncultured Ruminococcus sp.]|uniref:hypothetical protein n=1 Tax=uncultured Ruminococcus sp. TaxID=165186 RepID=UPI0025D32971|nr:hypothetical protein [uncultured Ruminococcus sp.]